MKTGRTEHLDLKDLTAWFCGCEPGETCVYALGDLACDRGEPTFRGAPITMLDAVGRATWAWHMRGFALLYQRRLAPPYYGFAYVVQRRMPSTEYEKQWIARERAALVTRLEAMVDA
jgi:hypothetical protein